MNTEEFNNLNTEKQVEYVNSRLQEGLTLRDVIERELKLTRSTMRDRFKKKGYVYNKKENKYFRDFNIKAEDTKTKSNIKSNTSNTSKNIDNAKDIENTNMKSNTKSNTSNIELNPTQIKALLELIEHKEDLLNLLDNKSLSESKEMDLSELEGNLKVKTVKIYEHIYDKYEKFRKKHKDLKQQDIINLALKEFIEKYY